MSSRLRSNSENSSSALRSSSTIAPSVCVGIVIAILAVAVSALSVANALVWGSASAATFCILAGVVVFIAALVNLIALA